MKKILILMLLTVTVFSQGLGYGVKGGFTTASNSEMDDSESGFVVGGTLTLDVIITKLDIEALYQSYGDKTTTSTIQIPATVRIGLLPIPMASLYLRAGVQYDYLVGGSGDGDGGAFEDQLDQFGQSGLSIVIGGGLELDLPVLPGAMIDVRYIIPTYNTLSDEFYEGFDAKKSTTSNLQITFGLNF